MTSPSPLQYCTIPHHNVVKSLPESAQVLLSWFYWHRNRETGQLNPKHATLARELRWSYWKVQRYVSILCAAGIVRAVKGQRGNSYEIRPSAEWHKGPQKQQPVSTPPDSSCVGNPATAEMPRQSAFILYEQETLLLKKETDAADKGSSCIGGGGSPAALNANAPTQNAEPVRKPPERSLKPMNRTQDECESIPVDSHRVPDEFALEAGRIVQELLPKHPAVGNAGRAVAVLARLLRAGTDPSTIRASHEQFRRMWENFRPGRFIPQLWRWISDGDWRYPPDEKQIERNSDPEILARREREVLRERNAIAEREEAERQRIQHERDVAVAMKHYHEKVKNAARQ